MDERNKKQESGKSLAGQWLGSTLPLLSAPGWGTKILQAAWHGHREKKERDLNIKKT